MDDEQLNFARYTSYHGFAASLHLARYALTRELCHNARVLDIPCGKGYGAALLAEGGAREVVGIDISAEAVAAATRSFSRPNTRYLCADIIAAEDPLTGEAPFDLIICCEAFEDVADPELLLHRLAGWRRPDGTIVITCPNKPAELPLGSNNEFHLRRWTHEEFRGRCEAVLGPATAWLLQTPCVGTMILSEQNLRTTSDSNFLSIMQACTVGSVQALPLPANTAPEWSDYLTYVGVWGVVPPELLLAAPASYTSYTKSQTGLDKDSPHPELQARYDQLAYAHRALQEQREQDRQQLLRYASGVVTPQKQRTSSSSRIIRLTGSPRTLKFYLWVLRTPVFGRPIRALRRAVLRILTVIS